MSGLSNSEALMKRFEESSKEQETNIVIELGTDRMIKWIGVYVLLALAGITKIVSIAGQALSCYPVSLGSSSEKTLITFANSYCWELNDIALSMSNFCSQNQTDYGQEWTNDPRQAKAFIRGIPYFMFAQAFFFSVPLAYWHFRVGSRLQGHLNFVKLLLSEMFLSFNKIARGIYLIPTRYDKKCAMFDGRRPYAPLDPVEGSKSEPTQPACNDGSTAASQSKKGSSESVKLLSCFPKTYSSDEPSDQVEAQRRKSIQKTEHKAPNSPDEISSFWTGNMKDRHLFSMLCYENFASLHHLPFILSVFQVTRTENETIESKGDKEEKESKENKEQKKWADRPLYGAILDIWCEEQNFDKTFLLKVYTGKHIFTAALGMMTLLALVLWLCFSDFVGMINVSTFRCYLAFDHACLFCSIKNIHEIFVVVLIDVFICVFVTVASLWKWFDVTKSKDIENSSLFKRLTEVRNVGFEASYLANKDKK